MVSTLILITYVCMFITLYSLSVVGSHNMLHNMLQDHNIQNNEI